MRGQRVRLILLQVVDDDNRTVGLVPVLSELGPSDLGTIIAEDRGVGCAVFPRGDFLTVLTLEIDDIDLRIQSVAEHKARPSGAHVLLGVPCRRQLRVQRGVHNVGLGDVKVVLSSKRFDGRSLKVVVFRELSTPNQQQQPTCFVPASRLIKFSPKDQIPSFWASVTENSDWCLGPR